MLSRKKILIVEDDAMIAMDLEYLFTDSGWDVIGPVASTKKAIALLQVETPDVATLDYNLGGETSAEIAAILCKKDVPFFYLTGRAQAIIDDEAPVAPILEKPASHAVLLKFAIRTLGK
jgi:DNA-binding response OmpR family regulator